MSNSFGSPCVTCGKELGSAIKKGHLLCKKCRSNDDIIRSEVVALEISPGFVDFGKIASPRKKKFLNWILRK